MESKRKEALGFVCSAGQVPKLCKETPTLVSGNTTCRQEHDAKRARLQAARWKRRQVAESSQGFQVSSSVSRRLQWKYRVFFTSVPVADRDSAIFFSKPRRHFQCSAQLSDENERQATEQASNSSNGHSSKIESVVPAPSGVNLDGTPKPQETPVSASQEETLKSSPETGEPISEATNVEHGIPSPSTSGVETGSEEREPMLASSANSHDASGKETGSAEAEESGEVSSPTSEGAPTPAVPGYTVVGGPVLRLYDQIPLEDLQALKSIFSFDTYFVTETIPFQNGAIFRGNMRYKGDSDKLLKILDERLHQLDLKEPYRLFLLANFEDDRPVVVAAPTRNDPPTTSTAQYVLALGLSTFSVLTSFEVGSAVLGVDIFVRPEEWIRAWPVAVGIFGLQVVHEIVQRIAARIHDVRLSPPFFLPSEQFGTFGAIVNLEQHSPTRNALLDIALSGPAASLVLSVIILTVGFFLPAGDAGPVVPPAFFTQSVITGSLAKAALGDLSLYSTASIKVNPAVVVGWAGMIVSALNLLPAGRLDGGRVAQAIFGRKVAGRISSITTFGLGVLALFGNNPLWLYWAALVIFLQRQSERPSINEVKPVDTVRQALAFAAFALAVIALAPFPLPSDPLNIF